MSKQKPLVFIPTYNERENVQTLCADLLGLGIDMDILFMDDNSPDGTGAVLDELSKRFANVFVSHRPEKLGIGRAHRDGIRWAREHGYTQLVTMDCDFTHPPSSIPEIINVAETSGADVVVGSRYLRKDSLNGWNSLRLFLTYSGHLATKTLLGMHQDATGGFRYYRLDQIPQSVFDLVRSNGYSFFFESLYVLFLNGFAVGEIPISLPPRTYGHSKMDFSEVKRSIGLLLSLYSTTLLNKENFIVGAELPPGIVNTEVQDQQGWDDYWNNHERAGAFFTMGWPRFTARSSSSKRWCISFGSSLHLARRFFMPVAAVVRWTLASPTTCRLRGSTFLSTRSSGTGRSTLKTRFYTEVFSISRFQASRSMASIISG